MESNNRRLQLTESTAKFKGITWCRKPIANTRVFWPIYDWLDRDVWTAIANHDWPYNRIYDAVLQVRQNRPATCGSRR